VTAAQLPTVAELEQALEYHAALARHYRQWGDNWPALIEQHHLIDALLYDRDEEKRRSQDLTPVAPPG
jgi:hypothetical protein